LTLIKDYAAQKLTDGKDSPLVVGDHYWNMMT